jgi:hypothetical protein
MVVSSTATMPARAPGLDRHVAEGHAAFHRQRRGSREPANSIA